MTDNEIIIEVAKLDGWEYFPDGHNYHCATPEHHKWFNTEDGCCYSEPRRYLTSHDAIVPVIEKQIKTKDKYPNELWDCFFEFLDEQDHGGFMTDSYLFATPRQLCIALLKATGKWID